MHIFFLPFIGREPSTWPANNCMFMHIVCVAANNILLMCKWDHAIFLPVITLAWKLQIASNPWVYSLKTPKNVCVGGYIIHYTITLNLARFCHTVLCSQYFITQGVEGERKGGGGILVPHSRSFLPKIPHPAIFFITFPNSSFVSKNNKVK